MTSDLPLLTTDITGEWLGEALSQPDAPVTVTELTERATVWGTATKVLFDVGYSDPSTGLPNRICVKGGFVPELRELMAHGYANQSPHPSSSTATRTRPTCSSPKRGR